MSPTAANIFCYSSITTWLPLVPLHEDHLMHEVTMEDKITKLSYLGEIANLGNLLHLLGTLSKDTKVVIMNFKHLCLFRCR